MAKAPKQAGNSTPKTEYIPEGKHYAVLYLIADLGTQFVQSKEFGDRDVRQIYLARELPEIKHTFNEEKGPQSVVFGQTLTFSMGKKAKLRSVVQNIIGKPMDDDKAEDYDVADLLGSVCKLNLVHNESYVNLFSIIDTEKNEKIIPELEQKSFFLDDFNKEVFSSLPSWLQDKIRVSPEYNAVAGNNPTESEADDMPF